MMNEKCDQHRVAAEFVFSFLLYSLLFMLVQKFLTAFTYTARSDNVVRRSLSTIHKPGWFDFRGRYYSPGSKQELYCIVYSHLLLGGEVTVFSGGPMSSDKWKKGLIEFIKVARQSSL